MHEIVVPRLNGNDDTCILVSWSLDSGDDITDQAELATVETSKAATELYSEATGVLHTLVAPGTECRVGETVGYVFADRQEREEFLRAAGAAAQAKVPEQAHAAAPGLVLTDAARALATSAGITEEQLRSLGKRIIREPDVRALTVAEAKSVLPPQQRAIAKVVTRSHRTVPDAFVAMKVYCDELLASLRERNARSTTVIGVAEVAVALLAALRPAHPRFFSSLADDETLVSPGETTDVGVTVDVGTGLFVPVVRNAAAIGLGDVADQLMDFRVMAMRKAFHEDDLAGGQITLSLNTDNDVLWAVPIILPPQVCIVSLGSVQPELTLGEDGQPRQRSCCTVGMTYDHRVINGQDAVEFLTAFKQAVERPLKEVL